MMRYEMLFAASAIMMTSSFALAGETLHEVDYADEQLFGFVPYSTASGDYHPEANLLYCDDFTLEKGATLNSVGWWGYSDFWDNPDLTNFTVWQVRIYAGDGQGEPGELIYDNVFDKADTNPQPQGPDGLFGSTMYYQQVNLGETIELEAGTQYWLGVGADVIDPASDWWIWAEAPPADQTIAKWLWDDQQWLVQGPEDFEDPTAPFNVAFKLIGEVDAGPVGDIDDDGTVGVSDLLLLLGEWGDCDDPNNCPGDLDNNNTIDVNDLLILLANWS